MSYILMFYYNPLESPFSKLIVFHIFLPEELAAKRHKRHRRAQKILPLFCVFCAFLRLTLPVPIFARPCLTPSGSIAHIEDAIEVSLHGDILHMRDV